MVFGNAPRHISTPFKKSALIMHGTWGGKTVNYAPDLNDVDLRFLDGKFMEDRLLELFPEKKSIYYISGYSKLDNYFQLTEEDRIKFLQSCHLDINKKTILYAPTFYPSSILKMGKKFPEDFAEYHFKTTLSSIFTKKIPERFASSRNMGQIPERVPSPL